MALDREQARAVARLARLGLSDEELDVLSGQLSQILDAFGKLAELDTTGVEPTAHVAPVRNVFREDRARPSLPRDEVLALAPEALDGYFKVPRILEE